MKQLTAAIYARYSSDNQRDESIDAQLRACREYAKNKDIQIICSYEDRAKTGTNAKREEFQNMIKCAKAGKFSILIVHKFDRFSRDKYDSVFYKRELKLAGVQLISVCEPLGDSPEDQLLESLMEGIAQWYSANLAREVMKGMKENAYNCKHTGGKPPLGYDVDQVTKTYRINENEAAAVRLIFRMYLDGSGYDKIINALNANGFQTKRGDPFGKNSIHDILANEKYSGMYIFNRASSKDGLGKRNNRKDKDPEKMIRIPDGMPAIVDTDTFSKCAKKLENNKRKSGSFKAKESYLLSGLVLCGECLKNNDPHNMVGNRVFSGRNKLKYVTYRCSHRDRTKKCINLDISKEYLEEYVVTTLADAFFNEKNVAAMVERVNKYISEAGDQSKREHDVAQTELAVVTKQMDNIADAIADGMNNDIIRAKFKKLALTKEKLESRIQQIDEYRQQKTVTEDTLQQLIVAAKPHLISRNKPELKNFIKEYVKRVIVYQEKIEVEFQFPGVVLSGGGEGNRTPVQKHCHIAFSERSQ